MECIVDGCTNEGRLKRPSDCPAHYAQITRYGLTAYKPLHYKSEVQGTCEVPTCERPVKNARICIPCRKKVNRYGITVEELVALDWSACQVCRKPAKHLDHDHATGKVRGALCQNCNLALGNVDDSPELLRRLADYLETHF